MLPWKFSNTSQAEVLAWRCFTKFTEKHLCRNLFFNKVGGLRTDTLLKKRLRRGNLRNFYERLF